MTAAASTPEQHSQADIRHALSGEFSVPNDIEGSSRTLAQLAVEATLTDGAIFTEVEIDKLEYTYAPSWASDVQTTILTDGLRLSRMILTRDTQQLIIDMHDNALTIETPTNRDILPLNTDTQRDFARYNVAFHARSFFNGE